MAQSNAKNWVFTVNNYTEEDEARLRQPSPLVLYLCVGKEVGEEGTPHLQGFVCFHKRTRFTAAKNFIGTRCHLEVAKTIKAADDYSKKDGDFFNYGTCPVRNSGKSRGDLDEFKQAVKDGKVKGPADMRENFSEVYAKYKLFCDSYLEDNAERRNVDPHALRIWQAQLIGMLRLPPHKRQIIFVVDPRGNSGKSWFANYYEDYCAPPGEVQILTPGKKADMSYALNTSIRVLFMDAPRSKQGEFIQYDFLENIKDGRVFNTKYESRLKKLGPVHVVVMMNEEPDMTMLSSDRYFIISVDTTNNVVAVDA